MTRSVTIATSLYEENSGISLDSVGSIPPGLTGILYSVGPGRFDIAGKNIGHWLDGFSVVSSIHISEKAIKYIHRFVGSAWYRGALIKDCIPLGGFGDHGTHTGRFPVNDNANMNLILRRGDLELLSYSPHSIFVDPLTLLTRGTRSRPGFLKGMDRYCIACPHPFLDDQTGERFDLLLSQRDPSGYIVTTTDASGHCRLLCRIPSTRLGLIHSFSVTQRWIIVVEAPFTARPHSISIRGGPSLGNFVWDAARGTRIIIVSRSNRSIVSVQEMRSLFMLHHINAWEMGDQIAVDVAAYGDPAILARLVLRKGRPSSGDIPPSLATRIAIDLDLSHVACAPLKCPPGDFYAIDRRFVMKPHRVVFVAGPNRVGQPGGLWCRYDMETGSTLCWNQDYCTPGPLVFVPASPESAEGNGWLLSIVLDTRKNRSFLLILDTTTMTETARVWLPYALPCALQSTFIPEGSGNEA